MPERLVVHDLRGYPPTDVFVDQLCDTPERRAQIGRGDVVPVDDRR
jgi:hypothetical protein